MIRIAISGKMGSGKSSFFEIARELYPDLDFVDEKFAGPIYESMRSVQRYLDLEPIKDGKLLQLLGSHYREQYGKKFWVEKFFDYETTRNHIVTDVRFPEELEECAERGYITVRIHRQDNLRLSCAANRDPHHISEIALDSVSDSAFDYIINNNGDIGLLEGAVTLIINNALRDRK